MNNDIIFSSVTFLKPQQNSCRISRERLSRKVTPVVFVVAEDATRSRPEV